MLYKKKEVAGRTLAIVSPKQLKEIHHLVFRSIKGVLV